MRPANHAMVSVCCFLTLLLLQATLLQAAARGGSSSRGSSGSRSSSTSSRSSSSRSYSRSSGGTSYSSLSRFVFSGFAWSVNYRAYRSGYYLTSRLWRQSHSDFTDSATVCFNYQDPLPSEYNSSVRIPWIYQNYTTYGIFACPLDGQESKTYCCGDDGAERCCTFWDDSGRVAGFTVGVIALAFILVFVIACGVKCAKAASSRTTSPVFDNAGADRGNDSDVKTQLPPPPPPYEMEWKREPVA